MSRTEFRRWRLAAFSVAAAAAAVTAVNIAAAGTLARLKFYWAINGTPTWHPETVAGPGSVR